MPKQTLVTTLTVQSLWLHRFRMQRMQGEIPCYKMYRGFCNIWKKDSLNVKITFKETDVRSLYLAAQIVEVRDKKDLTRNPCLLMKIIPSNSYPSYTLVSNPCLWRNLDDPHRKICNQYIGSHFSSESPWPFPVSLFNSFHKYPKHKCFHFTSCCLRLNTNGHSQANKFYGTTCT